MVTPAGLALQASGTVIIPATTICTDAALGTAGLGPGGGGQGRSESLNDDPHNLCAERLALEECTWGVDVRRTWSEREMVRTWDGRIIPGTPDGMFESWDGALTCVQVVRVPLAIDMNEGVMQETLAQTLLRKVVKSQHWLCTSHVVPHDFILFCWLPFDIPEVVMECALALMDRVRDLDPRFSMRLRTPADRDALFPPLFAHTSAKDRRSVTESDVSTYTGEASTSDDDDTCEWDITWAWEEDWSPSSLETGACVDGEEVGSEGESECEWDIAWGCGPEVDPLAEAAKLQSARGEAEVSCMGAIDGQSVIWDDGG